VFLRWRMRIGTDHSSTNWPGRGRERLARMDRRHPSPAGSEPAGSGEPRLYRSQHRKPTRSVGQCGDSPASGFRRFLSSTAGMSALAGRLGLDRRPCREENNMRYFVFSATCGNAAGSKTPRVRGRVVQAVSAVGGTGVITWYPALFSSRTILARRTRWLLALTAGARSA
jgi:hypothetical protein